MREEAERTNMMPHSRATAADGIKLLLREDVDRHGP